MRPPFRYSGPTVDAADGKEGFWFFMILFNSDGRKVRCVVTAGRAWSSCHSRSPGRIETRFLAIDGEHLEKVTKKIPPDSIQPENERFLRGWDRSQTYFLNTESPINVIFRQSWNPCIKLQKAKKIRSMNVTGEKAQTWIVEIHKDHLLYAVWNAAVEDWNVSCGTGVTAAVLPVQLKTCREYLKGNVQPAGENWRVSYF